MSVVPYTCEYCGSEWRNPISAAMCCDPTAYIDDDTDD